MTAKFALMVELLGRVSGRTLVVTTKHPAPDVAAAFRAVAGREAGGVLGIVDAVDRVGEGRRRERDETVRYVGTPGNLTRIGIEFSNLLESVSGADGRVGVGLHSLSPLVMHAGLQPVYRFLGELAARVRRDDHRSVVVLDTPVAEYDVESLRHHFDAVIETRPTDGGETALRVIGPREASAEWTRY